MDNRNNIIRKRGRPQGCSKVQGCLKIKNPNEQKIDVDGVQYNKYTSDHKTFTPRKARARTLFTAAWRDKQPALRRHERP